MQILKLAAIAMVLGVNFSVAYAQNMPTPKPEDAERDAFSPESRMNDNPPPQERVGAPNTAPK
jgi:hypothetical protein